MTNPNINKASVQDIISKSNEFPIPFPIDTIRCSTLNQRSDIEDGFLEKAINSAYPVLHEDVLELYIQFLDYKKKYGSSLEKDLYKEFGVTDLVQRILEKRAIMFVGQRDRFLLINNSSGYGGWEKIGTDEEKPPLILKDCLSYDEIKLSALLSVSSFSVFINDGRRKNNGIIAKDFNEIEQRGIIMGVVGTRLVENCRMEWEEIMITKQQNTTENGYGKNANSPLKQWRGIFAKCHDLDHFPSYEEISKPYFFGIFGNDKLFRPVEDIGYFNIRAYKRRIAITAETILIDANERAKAAGTTAFVHVIGYGLGVWKLAVFQDEEFLNAFSEVLTNLSADLTHVSDIRFAYFKTQNCGGIKNGEKFGNIRLFFSLEEPHTKLVDENSGKLLVVTYAWDGNAQPGNEFWKGSLSTSGDPAAACSTQVSELHNAHINSALISGNNLHVAIPGKGVLTFTEWTKNKQN